MRTPVAFLIFNRPETTARVFAEIAKARPPQLLLVADGPREDKTGEAEQCVATRAIVERVDWDCEVLTNYADKNMGCRARVSSGLDWVFEQVEEAIILEDDCLPNSSFFPFCEELLERYREDERVPMICGSNFLHGTRRSSESYYFSRFGHIWGWATWRRAWRQYDVTLSLWPGLRETSWLADILGDMQAASYWGERFDSVHRGQIDTWDYQWFFSWWAQNGLAVVPNTNLITNIGFGEMATHTKAAVKTMAELPTAALEFPLKHPPCMVRDKEADLYAFTQICPWAVVQPGFQAWVRKNIAPHLPASWRRSIGHFRAKSA